jgi:hypothetical protein
MSFFRYDGNTRINPGPVVAGAQIAVLTQPAVTTSFPGSPLATLYSASSSNAATISSASYNGGLIIFVFSSTPPSDVVTGSFINVTGVTPTGYNGVWQVVTVSGNNVTVAIPYTSTAANPGTYSSGGTVATSSLPNPLQSDGNGNWFFYASAGTYTIQIAGGNLSINPLVFPDQTVVSPGSGTVTSVALTAPAEFAVSGSPVTTSGTLAITKNTQSANLVYAGPGSGAAAQPTFRALVAADISGLGAGSVTSVGLSVTTPDWLSVAISGSPVTTTGTLTATITAANESANAVLAGPTSGGSGAPSFRALVAADLNVALAATTAATSGANQASPVLVVSGNIWNGSASTADAWSVQDVVGTGTNPTSALTLSHSGTTGNTSVNIQAELQNLNSTSGNAAYIQSKTFTLTSAEIKTLHSVPTQVLPAPGTGKTYLIVSSLAHYRYNTTAYTLNSSTRISLIFNNDQTNGQVWFLAGNPGFLDQTTDEYCNGGSFDGNVPTSDQVNKALFAATDVADPTLGDGTVTLSIQYTIVDTTIT